MARQVCKHIQFDGPIFFQKNDDGTGRCSVTITVDGHRIIVDGEAMKVSIQHCNGVYEWLSRPMAEALAEVQRDLNS